MESCCYLLFDMESTAVALRIQVSECIGESECAANSAAYAAIALCGRSGVWLSAQVWKLRADHMF